MKIECTIVKFIFIILVSHDAAIVADNSGPLLIAAASDLAPLEKPLARLVREKLGEEIRFSLGASGMLAAQIRNGAPYDLFLSANRTFVDGLAASGKIAGEPVSYARGRLAIFSNQPRKTLEDLATPGVRFIAIANPAHAPYGAAAMDLIKRSGLIGKLQPKLVYGENVRQTLQLAESGNADAAIVAWSLVKDRGGVLIPASRHAPIEQTAGVVKASRRQDAARRVLDLLLSAEGRKLLAEHGLEGVWPQAPVSK